MRKTIALMLAFVLALSLTACGATESAPENKTESGESGNGAVSVVLYIESTGAKLAAPKDLCVTPTQALLDQLSDMLGAKSVVLK